MKINLRIIKNTIKTYILKFAEMPISTVPRLFPSTITTKQREPSFTTKVIELALARRRYLPLYFLNSFTASDASRVAYWKYFWHKKILEKKPGFLNYEYQEA